MANVTDLPTSYNRDLTSLEIGRSRGFRDNRAFAQIVRAEDGSLQVDCGWVVPEADADDHDSFGYHPFKDGRPRPWVGRRVVATSEADALDVLAEFRAGLWGGPRPTRGAIIGSVTR